MNDDFIYRALPEVPQAFSQSLYARISANATFQSGPQLRLTRLRWLQVSVIMLGLLILVAWSQLRFWVRYVPIGDSWLVEFGQATRQGQSVVPFVPTPLLTHDWNRTLAPEELFFYLYFPSWVPEGFRGIAPCPGTTCYDQTIAQWSNDLGQRIRLFIEGKAGGMHPYAPAGMWKEVNINGQPGVLIYGRLALMKPGEKTRKWDEKLGLQLYRVIGKYVYVLETFGPYVSEQDLIRMAESMQELPPPWLTPTR